MSSSASFEMLHPDVVVLDPYYKAHRGDSNEERAVVDLMRYLDALRARYGFALILPAHPRKDQTGRDGARKLKLDDVAGSGAVTRGAELVLGLERLAHGVARLRVLKDRDGDLTVGEEWPLLFKRGRGSSLDPKEERQDSERRALELGSDGEWRISKEYAAALEIRPTAAKKLVDNLVAAGRVEMMVGAPGRSPKAVCYRTVPESRELSGTVGTVRPEQRDGSTVPDGYREPSERNRDLSASNGVGTVPSNGAVECLICGAAYALDPGAPELLRCPACVVVSVTA